MHPTIEALIHAMRLYAALDVCTGYFELSEMGAWFGLAPSLEQYVREELGRVTDDGEFIEAIVNNDNATAIMCAQREMERFIGA